MSVDTFLSPRELGAAIGASESSIKRWVDAGLLQAARTAGNHRRIARTEAIRFIREQRLTLARPEILSLPPAADASAGVAAAAERLYSALIEDRPDAARSLVFAQFVAGQAAATVLDSLVAPAMHRVGELWKHDDSGIFVEHRATDICLQTLAALRDAMPQAPEESPVALCCAPSGDPYVVPSLMVSIVLGDAGFRAVNLGPETPRAALEAAVERYRPALVCQSFSTATAPYSRDLSLFAAKLQAAGIPLVIGGRATEAASFPVPAGAQRLGSMVELFGFARGTALAATHAPGQAAAEASHKRRAPK